MEIHLTRMGYGTGCLLLKKEKKSKEEERKGTLHPGRGTSAQKTVANSIYRGLTPFPPLPLPSPLVCVAARLANFFLIMNDFARPGQPDFSCLLPASDHIKHKVKAAFQTSRNDKVSIGD